MTLRAVIIFLSCCGIQAVQSQCTAIPPGTVNTGSAAYATVIANDPFCCNTQWDALCQQAYDDLIGGGGCAVIPPANVDVNSPAYQQVIANDPFCCNILWDGVCQDAYDDLTGTPSCAVVPPPGVDVTSLAYQQVITDDPFCCNIAWDFVCQENYDLLTGGGGDPGTPVTAGDCTNAVEICTNYNFQINPNGFGSVYEIPALGTIGNPDLTPFNAPSAWGTNNWGCLRNGELNSTWMVINIWGTGTLEFTFGGFGTQAGFYDWIMYPYNASTCAQIPSGNLPPVRCNWNDIAGGGTGLAAVIPPGGFAANFEPPLAVVAGEQYIICFSNWSSVTTSVPLEFGGTAVVQCEDVTLPLELVGLQATAGVGSVDLTWSTASETGVDRFVIERSADLQHWEAIGEEPAMGDSQMLVEYGHRDPVPMMGENYYRLEMVDLDGTSAMSPTVAVRWDGLRPMITPNPNQGTFLVHSDHGGPVVHDAMGTAIAVQLAQVDARTWRVTMPPSAAGLYTVTCGDGVNGRQTRVVITPR